jgi:hypothetical protein
MTMIFEHQSHEDLYARVLVYLTQAFGELAEALDDDDPAFAISLGSANLLITVDANGPDTTSVLVLSQLAHGLSVTQEVMEFLLIKNHELPFGALSLGEDDVISFRHLLLGESVTKGTLSTLIRVMAAYATEIEDELNMRFR